MSNRGGAGAGSRGGVRTQDVRRALRSWRVKAAVQGVCSRVPGGTQVNRMLQQRVTGSATLTDAYLDQKWTHAAQHLDALAGPVGPGRRAVAAVELGTGWFPVVPVVLALGGVGPIRSVDVTDHLRTPPVLATLRGVARALAEGRHPEPAAGALDRLRDVLAVADRTGAQPTARDLLGELGIDAVVADARRLPLVTASVGLVVSNNTLEHLPVDMLDGCLREFRRVADDGAVMSHFIDLADHYAGFDDSITVYHFLRYSPRHWRWWNNSLHFQNRLRVPDYRAAHERSGWRVVAEQLTRRPVEQLRAVPLAREFRRYAEDDLLVCKALLTSVPV